MKKLINKILLYFNYVFAAFILLADISIFISPGDIWPAAFFGLAFPYLMILNLLLFIYWASIRRKEFFISLIALVLSIHNIHNTFQFPNIGSKEADVMSENQSEETLRVLTYNVQIFNLLGRNKFGEHQKLIFNYIKDENPDIICFQEFYISNSKDFQLNKVNKILSRYPYRHIEWIVDGNESKYGIAVYSKHPIVNKKTISFRNTNNSTIFSDILIKEDTIRFFNNHLQSIKFDRQNYKFISNQSTYSQSQKLKELQDISFRLRDAFIKRAEQADFLSDVIKRSPHPVIVCGDFNDTPVSYTYRKIKGDLMDSFLEAGSGFGPTYEGKFPSYRIDYILHSPALKTVYYESERVKFSDHYPVIAGIRLN